MKSSQPVDKNQEIVNFGYNYLAKKTEKYAFTITIPPYLENCPFTACGFWNVGFGVCFELLASLQGFGGEF